VDDSEPHQFTSLRERFIDFRTFWVVFSLHPRGGLSSSSPREAVKICQYVLKLPANRAMNWMLE